MSKRPSVLQFIDPEKEGRTMTKHRYSVTFGEKTATRESEAPYEFASCKRGELGWEIRFHKTYASARRVAGRYGDVKAVTKLS